MNLRPKTKRRLTILLTAVITTTAALSAVVVFRLHKYEQRRLRYRAQAIVAFERGDYRTAAANFSRYLSNDRVDPEAIFDLAICRTKLPRPDLGNLTDAMKLLLELPPDNPEAQHLLLDIDQRLGSPTDTLTIADSLLKTNPDDVAALSARLRLLTRDGKYTDALPIARRLNDLTPGDLHAQVTTLDLMSRLHVPPAQIIGRADGLLAEHPADPRFQLLRAAAAYYANDAAGATRWLRTAASVLPSDADFILILVGSFDRLSLWDDARQVLEKAAAEPGAPSEIRAALAQRQFELEQYDAGLGLLDDVRPQNAAADSRLLGLRGLLLFSRDHPSSRHPSVGFDEIVAMLQTRSETDLIANAWCLLLKVLSDDPSLDPLERVRKCHTAARLDPDNADARFYLGLEYQRIGENELALQCLRQAVQLEPAWPGAYERISAILLGRGQINEAIASAQAACDRDPKSTGPQIALVAARWAGLGSSSAEIAPLLNTIVRLRTISDDPLLPAAEIDLLARSGRGPDASAVASAVIAAARLPALGRLQAIDRTDHLDLASVIADRAAHCQPDTPEQALEQIKVLSAAGKPDLAKQLLLPMSAHQSVDWELAALQARETIGDLHTAAGWEKLADSQPHNLPVQLAALHSLAASENRGLMDRIIDRVRNLTGEDSLEWRIARARWQLTDADDGRNNATSIAASMAEVARVAPQYAVPQIIWADALLRLSDNSGAMAHLRQAALLDPGNSGISLRLARVLMEQGQTPDAIRLLDRLANNPAITNAQRVETAGLYRQAGKSDAAIQLLKNDRSIHSDDLPGDLLLAQLLTEHGNKSEASEIYDRIIQQPTTSSQAVVAAAWFYASHGEPEHARQSLGRLNELPLAPGEKEIVLGEFECSFGSLATAALEFQNATHLAAKSPHSWLALAGLNLRDRDFSQAAKVAGEGLKNIPDSLPLKAMKERARTLMGIKLDDDIQPLLDSLGADPTSDGAAATLAAIADSQTARESADALADRLAAVVEQDDHYVPALTMLVNRDCTAGRFERAETTARRVTDLMPIDPEPARLLTMVCATTEQWDRALAAAIGWRSRTLDHPLAADLAIATAQLALQHPREAVDQLAPYMSYAISEAAGNKSGTAATTVDLYLKALCLDDRFSQARAMVDPLADQWPAWRRRWLGILSMTARDPGEGTRQIREIEPALSATNIDDQLSRGQAWYELGTRFNDTACLQKALAVIDPLTDATPVPADTWLLLGGINQQLDHLPEARIAFTKAVQLAPDSAIAKNNLAMVMWLANQDLQSAQKLAATAVNLSPASSAMHSTLGEIDYALNDLDAARLQFEAAVRLNQQNAEAMIGLAAVQDRAEHLDEMLLPRIESIISRRHPALPPPVRQELQRLRDGKTPHSVGMATPGRVRVLKAIGGAVRSGQGRVSDQMSFAW